MDEASVASQIFIASTTTTTDFSLATTISRITIWPGNHTRVLTTLSLYGPGSGPAPVVTEVVAGHSITDTGLGTATVLVTDYDIAYPTALLSRPSDGSHTTTTHSTSSSVSPSPSINTKVLSKADAAGISIGSAILGALIAACVAILLFRRKPKTFRRPDEDFGSSAKAVDLEETQSGDTILLAPIHDTLPQPRSHSAIISEMSQLGTRIRNHAANFYAQRAVDIRILELEEDVLIAIGLDQRSQSKLLDMLASADGREEAIRHIIAQKIFASILMPGNPETSFLPSSILEIQRNMSANATGDGVSKLQNAWRVATARLVIDSYIHTSQPNVHDAYTSLAALLRPMVEMDKVQQWSENLQSVLSYAAQFGWGLFSQLANYEFIWEETSTEFVVYPGLLQVTSDEGVMLSKKQFLTAPIRH